MKARRPLFPLLFVALAVGCVDGASGGDDDATPAPDVALADGAPTADVAPPAPDAVARDAAARDAAPDAAPPPVDMGPEVDAAPPECAAGERSCVPDGPPARIECIGGRFAVVPCAAGEVCLGDGACVPDPATCEEGQRTCLGDLQPATCVPGEGWVEESPCLPGRVCSGTGVCRAPTCVDGARRSYLGCDFYATDLPNLAYGFGGTPDAPLGLVLTNPDPELRSRVWLRSPDGSPAELVGEVTIQAPPQALGAPAVTVYSELRRADGQLVEQGFDEAHSVDIPGGGMGIFLLPHHPYREDSHAAFSSWRVETDRPVAAYQFNPYCCNYSFTNDASLLLPIPALGTDYIYLGVPAWQEPFEPDPGDPNPGPPGSLPATLTVVGTRDATAVRIELRDGMAVEPDGAGRVAINGQTVTATLDAGEVLNLVTPPPVDRGGRPPISVDLTGARITADHPIAAFSGHLCTFYPWDQGACDHLEEQLFPVDTWGNQFVLAPTVLRTETPDLATEATFWKIVARDPETRIRLSVPFDQLDPSRPGFDGVQDCRAALEDPETLLLQSGESCEFGTRAPLALGSNRPISVMGILSGQASVGLLGQNAGDPAIFLLPPEYQYRRDYAFLTPTTYFVDYLTVVAPPDANLTLDGEPLDMNNTILVPGSTQVYKHFEVSDGPHRIAGDQPFGILVYAYDDYVSYAYTGGQNIIKR